MGERTISGTFEIAMNLTNSRQLKMTGYVFSDDTTAEVNARLDMNQDAIDRQFIRCDIVTKEAQRVALLQQMDDVRKLFNNTLDKRNAGKKLTSQDRTNLDQGEAALKGRQDQIESLDKMIAEAKLKVGMT